MATSKDVARLAGTSIATVSYVFNNGPRPVREETKARVLLAAKELGYKPNAAARALITGKTSTFGLVVPSILNPFFGELSHSLDIASRNENHLLLIADSDMDSEKEGRHLEAFVNRRVDGVVLVSCDVSKSKILLLEKNSIPLVALHPMPQYPSALAVHMDYPKAAKELALHLVQVHKVESILMVLANGESGALQHEQGVREACSVSGKVALKKLETSVARADVYHKLIEFLSRNPLPDAIYCATDEQAYGVLAGLGNQGIKSPNDVLVVGFDGTIHSEFSTPSLTSYKQPLDEIAARAISLLMGKSLGDPSDGQLLGELVIRRSCGC